MKLHHLRATDSGAISSTETAFGAIIISANDRNSMRFLNLLCVSTLVCTVLIITIQKVEKHNLS